MRECSVFGLPDERLGEVVGAAVWLHADQAGSEYTLDAVVACACQVDYDGLFVTAAVTAELSKVAEETLARFKVPLPGNIFKQDGELPKGATGKIDKKLLREQYKDLAGTGAEMQAKI